MKGEFYINIFYFIKNQKKILQNLNYFDEIVKYLNLKNREIRLNTITPLIEII